MAKQRRMSSYKLSRSLPNSGGSRRVLGETSVVDLRGCACDGDDDAPDDKDRRRSSLNDMAAVRRMSRMDVDYRALAEELKSLDVDEEKKESDIPGPSAPGAGVEEKKEPTPPPDLYLELVLATKQNTQSVGWFITDAEDAKPEEEIGIPFYSTVSEGANFEHADWKDQPCVRQARIRWRDDHRVSWLERHMEMTQGFMCVGSTPGLFVLGEPTHNRPDLTETQRQFPDFSRMKAYIIPGGCGIIIKKGTWHDFPVSVGPDLTAFIINTEEVVEALSSMEEAGPMDFGDCYKIRYTDVYDDVTLRFPDPRPFVEKMGLINNGNTHVATKQQQTPPLIETKTITENLTTNSISEETNVEAGGDYYGNGVKRIEVETTNWGGGGERSCVWVVPVVNVEHFDPSSFGPSVQPHLNRAGQREVANRGWRGYGNRRGLKRIRTLFKRHSIPCTAVVSSDLAVHDPEVVQQLRAFQKEDGWEIGAHGANNTNGGHAGLSIDDEKAAIDACLDQLGEAFFNDGDGSGDVEGQVNNKKKPSTWLTPGFSVTEQTSRLLVDAGIETLLDFVDDDVPFGLARDDGAEEGESDSSTSAAQTPEAVCLPYSMETNDFSLVLTRNLSPREYAAALESHVLQLAYEARTSGQHRVVCFGMHTFVAGAPASVYELNKVLSRLCEVSNVTFATASEVRAAVRSGGKSAASEEEYEESAAATEPSATPSPGSLTNRVLQFKATPCGVLNVDIHCAGLLLIDFQMDFMVPGGFGEQLGNDVATLRRAIEPTQRVLAAARNAGLTVVHTREGHRPDLSDLNALKAGDGTVIGSKGPYGRILIRGEKGHDIITELYPLENEHVVDKPGKGAFYQTDLELLLQNAGIDTLLVCGVTTEVCVHTTVREANDRGIRCVVLEDCTASYFPEFHKVGISMISSQGGIFGQISDATSVIKGLNDIKSTEA